MCGFDGELNENALLIRSASLMRVHVALAAGFDPPGQPGVVTVACSCCRVVHGVLTFTLLVTVILLVRAARALLFSVIAVGMCNAASSFFVLI